MSAQDEYKEKITPLLVDIIKELVHQETSMGCTDKVLDEVEDNSIVLTAIGLAATIPPVTKWPQKLNGVVYENEIEYRRKRLIEATAYLMLEIRRLDRLITPPPVTPKTDSKSKTVVKLIRSSSGLSDVF